MPKPNRVRRNTPTAKRTRSDDDLDKTNGQGKDLKTPKLEPIEQDADDEVPELTANVAALSDAESKWENLVYYYLARLKGLCDWRVDSNPPEKSRNTSRASFKSCSSDNLEKRVLKNVVKENYPEPDKYWAKNKQIENRGIQSEVGTYMSAGYQQGKEQGVKIITRALKYGELAGILKRDGENYKIEPKFLKKAPSRESTSNSETSIASGSSTGSDTSVEKTKKKRRTGQGAKLDKFKNKPESRLRVKRSYDQLELQHDIEPGPTRAENCRELSKDLIESEANLKRTLPHGAMNPFDNQKQPKQIKTTAGHSRDLSENRPGTSKDVKLLNQLPRKQTKLSTNKKQKIRNIPSTKLRTAPTRDGLRSRKVSSKAHTPYRSKRSHNNGSRSKNKGQKRQKYRSKSSTSSRSKSSTSSRSKSSTSSRSNHSNY